MDAGNLPALMVTRAWSAVATWRLAMSDGSQPALAGTLIGPLCQASQTPDISVAPARERTTRRHGTLSGSPLRRNWMLVPHDVAVRAAVAVTCVAGFAAERVMVTGGWPASLGASQSPPAAPAKAATHAATAATRHDRPGRVAGFARPGRPAVSMSSGTRASTPGNGPRRASSARHLGQPGR
jgi:hypothetical protein